MKNQVGVKKKARERERQQFPQIECLSDKGYQVLCEQNNNCALTVVTEPLRQ